MDLQVGGSSAASLLPIGTVWVAQVARASSVSVLPDQSVILSHDASRTGLDTVRAVNKVCTLDAVVWALKNSTGNTLKYLLILKMEIILTVNTSCEQ